MPRTARKESQSGMYHVMLRGINQQQIFEDDEDNEKFLEILKDCTDANAFKLYAYCLMGNHVHLLIKVAAEGLEQIFKKIGVKYVYWYNWKYNRSGHLFQDRFKSEPVESDEYFFTVIRYIHQNPVKAGLVDSIDAYKWSSYKEYEGAKGITDVSFVRKTMALDKFIKFNKEENNDACLESATSRKTDKDAKEVMKKLMNCDTIEAFQNLDAATRKLCLKSLKDEGLSIRQISRLTGVSKGIVERA